MNIMDKKFTARQLISSAFLLAIYLWLCGCNPLTAQAPNKTLSNNYPETAQYYLERAKNASSHEKAAFQLKAAGRYIQDHQFSQADSLLNQINTEGLPEQFVAQKYILSANLALMQNQGEKGLHFLKRIPDPTHLPLKKQVAYYQLLAIAHLQLNQPLESAKARIIVDPLLTDKNEQQQNRQQIWSALNQASIRTLTTELRNPANNQQLQGWVDIVYITKQYKEDPDLYNDEVNRWHQRFPRHEANALLQPAQESANNASTSFSNVPTATQERPFISGKSAKIALLLPITGKLAQSGQAIRSGFMAGYYENQARGGHAELIEVYNTAKGNVNELYKKAVKDGAALIIGPLTKEDVQSIQKMGNLPIPTLALNSTQGQNAQNFYQYALSPQDEAAQAALKARQDGLSRALVIVPADSWGQGIGDIFQQSFDRKGGTVVETLRYSKNTNMDEAIQTALHVVKKKKRLFTKNKESEKNEAQTPMRRQDIDMIFLVATPQKARQINPLLKFHYAENLPVYATSQIYYGQVNQITDKDLNGIKFCDMPWVLEDTNQIRQAKSQMHQLIPNIRAQNARLFAFGYDAYTLSTSLMQNESNAYSGLKGVTGTLYISNNHQILRQLEWAQFRNGVPRS